MQKTKSWASIALIACALAACKDNTTDETHSDASTGDAANVTDHDASQLGDANTNVTDDGGNDIDGGAGEGGVTTDLGAGDTGPDAYVDLHPDELSLEELPAVMAQIVCDNPTCWQPASDGLRSIDGRQGAQLALIATGGLTGEACLEHATAVFERYVDAYELGVMYGYTYDAVAAQDCVDGGDAVCDASWLSMRGTFCNALRGTTEIGETCSADVECIAGEHIYCGSAYLLRPENRCVEATRNVGETCTSSDDCIRDGYVSVSCEGYDSESYCVGTRQTIVALGESCASALDSGSPVDYIRETLACAEGSYCARGIDTQVCTATLAEGATCSDPNACSAGLACVTTEGTITPTVLEGTCEPIELVTTAGEVCTMAGQQVCDVASGLVCVAATTKSPRPDSTCELVTDGSLDTPCAVADPRRPRGSYATILTTPCASGLYCNDPVNNGVLSISGTRIDTGGRCAAQLSDGEPCFNTAMCASGICEWNDAMSENQCGHYVPTSTPDAGVDAG